MILRQNEIDTKDEQFTCEFAKTIICKEQIALGILNLHTKLFYLLIETTSDEIETHVPMKKQDTTEDVEQLKGYNFKELTM